MVQILTKELQMIIVIIQTSDVSISNGSIKYLLKTSIFYSRFDVKALSMLPLPTLESEILFIVP